ncbi:hypothetical protein [Methylotenera versatilis]|uniref:hypothetical protein n=1 Tax=Methylotenera versatilis TaxID=1055487 RepID=UPI0006467124|nr:hypothetical protein [Methylotenera versatilis]
MTIAKVWVRLLQAITVVCLLFVATAASAVELAVNAGAASVASAIAEAPSVLDYLTDKDEKYIGPSVEDNILTMDSDKNGFADVFEVRAFLASIHGKDYQKDLLDKWEASASGKSCSTPFAKELYTDKTY